MSAELLRLLQTAPKAAQLIATARAAAKGDPDALSYIKSGGWAEAVDLVSPGMGTTARTALEQARDAAERIRETVSGQVLEGEYSVLEADGDVHQRNPWDGFVGRLQRQRYGGHIVLGPPGFGKTELAKALAYRWMRGHGWPVELYGFYPEDAPAWGRTMSMQTLVHRMEKLQDYLDAHEGRDPDEEEGDPEEEEDRPEPSLPPTERIIVIDESSMAMTTSAADPRRNAVIKALAHCRHVNWLVVLIAQMTGLVALPMLGQTTVWSKQPSGAEIDTDRDNPRVRRFWQEAMGSFEALKRSPYWPMCPEVRAWSYVESPSVGGQSGYRGMVPNGLAPDCVEEE